MMKADLMRMVRNCIIYSPEIRFGDDLCYAIHVGRLKIAWATTNRVPSTTRLPNRWWRYVGLSILFCVVFELTLWLPSQSIVDAFDDGEMAGANDSGVQ